jgi:predicted N-acetyltransferase YhbS
MIDIRVEEPGDLPAIRMVNKRAFGQPEEAFMVMFLDATGKGNVSGIARYRGEFDEAM